MKFKQLVPNHKSIIIAENGARSDSKRCVFFLFPEITLMREFKTIIQGK